MVDRISQLRDRLQSLRQELGKSMRQEWKRDLPFCEMLFNRWERAKELGFGEGTSVYQSCHIIGDVHVGEHTWIGPFTILDGSGGLQIGSYCSISSGAQIYSHNTVRWALSGGVHEYERKPTKIGNCCYIGAQSVVSMGVSIGDHCLIGVNAFVNRDIPDHKIAFGTPCRIVGTVKQVGESVVLAFDGDE